MALKKSKLYASLWASCDGLRGAMDASQYKDYVLVLLFIKYVSDKYAGQPYAPITIPPGASFKDMVALKGKPDIGDQINKKILAPLFSANKLSEPPNFNDDEKLGTGKAKVARLTDLIAIFENPALDFSKNRAEGDDILGDAYEYLMRHFATESGKSKGQFYTPAEVSRIMAQIIGIHNTKTSSTTTVYDPTCGSGSLLLKVGAEAGTAVTLYGQEKDAATSGLARMNMILHNNAGALVVQGDTLADPKFKDGDALKTFDYVVANPPFSDKRWSTGVDPLNDRYDRFTPFGTPPARKGDYAYLLHIIRSLKSTGKGACILPHGVLFRGSAEADIRRALVRKGYIKGLIGLPPNLFYGTGIPACIVVIDKEDALARKGIFVIDASGGFRKDGPKNRLRDMDIHKIVDVFKRQLEMPKYSRMVPLEEIARNEFNLNLPRYIDSSEPEDLQDIDGHLRGGIPEQDLDALGAYWKVLPSVCAVLFESAGRHGYSRLKLPLTEVKQAILGHAEFAAFQQNATKGFEDWCKIAATRLSGFERNGHPKVLIETIAEDLLAAFRKAPLLDAYDVYQHLMDYWTETMQDDAYLIAADGWVVGVQPREILQVRNKENRLIWPEPHDYLRGKRRFKSDLVPASILVARYFVSESDAIEALDIQLATLEQQLDEMREENSAEEGLLAEANEANEGEAPKISAKSVRAALKKLDSDPDEAEAIKALETYSSMLEQQAKLKARRKAAQEDLDRKVDAKYPKLSEAEIKTLIVEDKWMASLSAAVEGELHRVSHTLTDRIRELAERYATPMPQLTDDVAALSARVEEHLAMMGASWK